MTPDMSVGLNESKNFIWNTQCESDCLGEGTFGKVYLGVDKRTGDKVAVKTFKDVTQQVSQETKMLQTLKHEYIIQFLAIEYEENNKSKVMVMELCNGGSLLSFLNDPENAYGLQDNEFLLVFGHLAGGLEYLKKHDVIHRDVKPENIMRHVMDDGRVIYKLADFGSARELPEGQNFSSLHGTLPYLNPQMFRGACDPEFCREFGANTDLWSIGVTLYQTATCKLPFRVQERRLTLRIFDEMKQNEGIIAASQQGNSEEIVFEKKLPKMCRLSVGLKQLITPIIAGLFIQDPEKQWSFTQYYGHVLDTVSRKMINVFYINKMQMLNVYIQTDESFHDFKYYVSQQTEVDDENQVYLYKRNLIINCFEDFSNVESECIFLFDRSNSDVALAYNAPLVYGNLSSFPVKFMSGFEGDTRLAYLARRDLCFCKILMDDKSRVYRFFVTFIRDFQSYCKEEVKDQYKIYGMLMEKYSNTKSRVKTLENLQHLSQPADLEFIQEFRVRSDDVVNQASKLFDHLDNIESRVHFNTSHDSYLRIASKELLDLKELSKKLYSCKGYKKLYDYEKIKIVRCVRTILEMFRDKMDPNFDNFVDDMKRWYGEHFFSHVRSMSILKKLLQRYKYDLKNFEEEIDKKCEDTLSGLLKTKKKLFDKQKLLDTLAKYKDNNMDIKFIIEENLRLVEKLGELILTLDVDFSTQL